MSFKLLKNILIPIITLIIFLEIIFQILSFSKSNLISKPILFFNPYCDQEYWNFQKQTQITDKSYEYHSCSDTSSREKDQWRFMFEVPVVYSAGLVLVAVVLLGVLIGLCVSLQPALADTPRVIRQFSFTPRGVQSPRAYFSTTPRQRRGF